MYVCHHLLAFSACRGSGSPWTLSLANIFQCQPWIHPGYLCCKGKVGWVLTTLIVWTYKLNTADSFQRCEVEVSLNTECRCTFCPATAIASFFGSTFFPLDGEAWSVALATLGFMYLDGLELRDPAAQYSCQAHQTSCVEELGLWVMLSTELIYWTLCSNILFS